MAPGDYFLPYMKLIDFIIWDQLIKTGYYPNDEKDELKQKAYLDLLEREDKILGSFQNKSNFSAFLSVVVINFCRELKRKRIREKSKQSGYNQQERNRFFLFLQAANLNAEQLIVFNEYCKKLYFILQTYPNSRQKLFICLKALFRLNVLLNELPLQHIQDEQLNTIKLCLDSLNSLSSKLKDQDVYSELTSIIDFHGNKPSVFYE